MVKKSFLLPPCDRSLLKVDDSVIQTLAYESTHVIDVRRVRLHSINDTLKNSPTYNDITYDVTLTEIQTIVSDPSS